MELDGVVFDVDGTLVDTTYLHAVAWSEALAQQGAPVPTARVHRAVGMGATELLDEVTGGADRPTDFDEAVTAAHRALYAQYYGHLRALPGAVELLRWCHASGRRTVLATSASPQELAQLTAALDADEAIDLTTSAADADAGKPDPGIVQAALDGARLAPGRAVMVGDSVWDAQAADRAGVAFIGLACGGTSEAELVRAGAMEVWRDPAHLLDHRDASVLGQP